MSQIVQGLGCLIRGFGWIIRRPRLFLLGAIPPVITSLLFIVIVISMFSWLPGLAGAVTGFAESWAPGVRETARGLAMVLIFAGTILVMVVAFSSVTLLIGSPCYERIVTGVDRELGGAGDTSPVAESALRSIGQSLLVVVMSLIGPIGFFFVGLIPVIGTITAAVGGAVFGGWLIALELAGQPLQKRGVATLRARNRILRWRPWATLGFGVPTFLLLSIPLISILTFPAATAGGVLLVRAAAGANNPTRGQKSSGSSPAAPKSS